MFLSLSICINLFIYLYIYLSQIVSICFYLSIYLSQIVSICFYLSIYLSISDCIHLFLSIYLSISDCIHLFLSIYLSIYLYIYIYIYIRGIYKKNTLEILLFKDYSRYWHSGYKVLKRNIWSLLLRFSASSSALFSIKVPETIAVEKAFLRAWNKQNKFWYCCAMHFWKSRPIKLSYLWLIQKISNRNDYLKIDWSVFILVTLATDSRPRQKLQISQIVVKFYRNGFLRNVLQSLSQVFSKWSKSTTGANKILVEWIKAEAFAFTWCLQ